METELFYNAYFLSDESFKINFSKKGEGRPQASPPPTLCQAEQITAHKFMFRTCPYLLNFAQLT
jgi:hypothetical protein